MPPVQNELIIGGGRGELYQRSNGLALYVMNKHHELQRQRRDRIGDRLYDLCVDMRLKHSAFFNGIGNRLEVNTENFEATLKSVMSEILAENCNFGRVVSLYTFCIAMSEFCFENLGDQKNQYETIAKNAALAMCDHLDWFETHDSWVSLFFCQSLHYVCSQIASKLYL